MNRLWGVATLSLATFAIGLLALAASEERTWTSVGVSASNGANNTTITVTVSGLPENEKWKDVHLYAAFGSKLPRLGGGGGSTVTVTPQGGGNGQSWTRSRTENGRVLNIYADGANGFGDGTYTVTIEWNAGDFAKAAQRAATWKATRDGNNEAGAGDVIGSSDGQQAPNVPQITAMINQDDDMRLFLDTTRTAEIATEPGFADAPYEVYASTRLNPDYTDPLGIGIETEDYPVPTSWNLTFANFTGLIDADGQTEWHPSITVPDDDDIVRKVFYLVFAVKDDGVPGIASAPIQCTILAP